MILLKKIVSILIGLSIALFSSSFTFANLNSSYIVVEKSTLRVLEGENYDQQSLVASTAKILTAITAIENYSIDEEIKVSSKDVNEEGSKVYLKENDYIKRIDLLHALMLRSANDAASALSNNNSEEFIFKMNELAKKIGMKNSVFSNASGLDEREYNLSTAYDMAILAAYCANNQTFVEISSAHTYKCMTKESSYSWSNKHKLVTNDENFIWGKTGYTKKAKRILVSNYIKDNMDVIIVTINKSDDWKYHSSLVDKLNDYNFILIYKKGIYDITFERKYYLLINENIIIPMKSDEENNISIKFDIYDDKAIMNVYLKNEIIFKDTFKVVKKISVDDYLNVYL